jgi:hypothetical protein
MDQNRVKNIDHLNLRSVNHTTVAERIGCLLFRLLRKDLKQAAVKVRFVKRLGADADKGAKIPVGRGVNTESRSNKVFRKSGANSFTHTTLLHPKAGKESAGVFKINGSENRKGALTLYI